MDVGTVSPPVYPGTGNSAEPTSRMLKRMAPQGAEGIINYIGSRGQDSEKAVEITAKHRHEADAAAKVKTDRFEKAEKNADSTQAKEQLKATTAAASSTKPEVPKEHVVEHPSPKDSVYSASGDVKTEEVAPAESGESVDLKA